MCELSGATNPSYLLVAADLGATLRVRVTATNATGPGVAVTSVQSGVVVAQPSGVPVNSVPPVISGTAQVGQTLSSSTGTWSGSPTSYAYQWSRCNSTGGSCVDIGGATNPSYLLVAADLGATLRVRVTASNATGPGVAVTSGQSAVVVGVPVAGAFPSGGVLDAFGRADASPLSGSWSGPVKSTQGPLRLVGGQAASGLASYNSGWYTGSQFGPDMDVFVTVTGLPANGQQISLLARVQNPGSATLMRSYNFVYKVGSGFEYWRGVNGGTYAQLGATIASPALVDRGWSRFPRPGQHPDRLLPQSRCLDSVGVPHRHRDHRGRLRRSGAERRQQQRPRRRLRRHHDQHRTSRRTHKQRLARNHGHRPGRTNTLELDGHLEWAAPPPTPISGRAATTAARRVWTSAAPPTPPICSSQQTREQRCGCG